MYSARNFFNHIGQATKRAWQSEVVSPVPSRFGSGTIKTTVGEMITTHSIWFAPTIGCIGYAIYSDGQKNITDDHKHSASQKETDPSAKWTSTVTSKV